MATLGDLVTAVSLDVRDTINATWTTAEIARKVNQGIDALAAFYPKEIVSTFATIAAGTRTYAASSFSTIYRIDQYNGTTLQNSLPSGVGEGPDSGWELHAGIVYLPPTQPWTAGNTLRAFGYGPYIQLSASTSTTDLDTAGMYAVEVFAASKLLGFLAADRASFQQSQADTAATDVNLPQLAQLAAFYRNEWEAEKQRLRRPRKLG